MVTKGRFYLSPFKKDTPKRECLMINCAIQYAGSEKIHVEQYCNEHKSHNKYLCDLLKLTLY